MYFIISDFPRIQLVNPDFNRNKYMSFQTIFGDTFFHAIRARKLAARGGHI